MSPHAIHSAPYLPVIKNAVTLWGRLQRVRFQQLGDRNAEVFAGGVLGVIPVEQRHQLRAGRPRDGVTAIVFAFALDLATSDLGEQIADMVLLDILNIHVRPFRHHVQIKDSFGLWPSPIFLGVIFNETVNGFGELAG
jgi:hypothetical protein